MTLDTMAHVTRKKISSDDLIWHITEESNNAVIEESINQANAAMVAAHVKASGSSRGQNDKGKGKANEGGKAKKCQNCNKTRHMKANCWRKGGGKADSAPNWYKKRIAETKGKQSTNATANDDDDRKLHNYSNSP